MNRARISLLCLGALLLIAAVAGVLLGTPVVAPGDALAVLLGEQIPGISFIVMDSRLPTVAVAILAGISFGLSGTVFQTLLRNPLADRLMAGLASLGDFAVLAPASLLALAWLLWRRRWIAAAPMPPSKYKPKRSRISR